MNEVVTVWLALTLLFAIAAYLLLPFRRAWACVGALLIAAVVSLPLASVGLGSCSPWVPRNGKLTVNGARIDVDKAIYVLLSRGSEPPQCYVLPYSKQQAQQLQMLNDATAGEPGAIVMNMDGQPGGEFEDGRPAETETKQAERPIYGG